MTDETIKGSFHADYERLDSLLKTFQTIRESDTVQAQRFFLEFKTGLENHMRWEEDILFPLFEEKTGLRGWGPTEKMRAEHDEIRQMLIVFEEMMTNHHVCTDIQQDDLLMLLSTHSIKEENALYPLLDKLLTPEERRTVLHQTMHSDTRSVS